MASTIFTVFALLFLQADRVRSATFVPASCNSSEGYGWANNSLGQDPCTVATFLGGACNGGQYSIPAINSTESYSGPNSTEQNSCRCSTVFYSVLMACAACQGGAPITWSSYAMSCHTVYVADFNETIPPGTAVQHWAYLNVTLNGFNATTAQLDGDSPESVGVPQATLSSTPSSTSAASTASSKSNTGAIAGGVVGGIVFVVLIVAAAFWFLRRRRSQPPVSHRELLSPDMTGTAQTITSYPSTQQRIYDPPTQVPILR
ncbi:hypothetical protein BDP27DRAFT_1443570 [Rhodocollybia butyracea]|uniref:Uncharacterized protein n=1 Tax=Rhodocollybia butyracea TaxID=206335 RepID=A0A9P5PYW3_9AGAR|nr:hypothetical protein BDP27DRAFT_1443570 [Rhodocollybia butyracea]